MQQKQNRFYFSNEQKLQGRTIDGCCFGSLVQREREREREREVDRQTDIQTSRLR